jgi:hypothetical protein
MKEPRVTVFLSQSTRSLIDPTAGAVVVNGDALPVFGLSFDAAEGQEELVLRIPMRYVKVIHGDILEPKGGGDAV